MHHHHIDPEVFARACCEYGDLNGREAFETHLHLLGGCAECITGILDYFDLESFEELAALQQPSTELTNRAAQREVEPLVSWLSTLSNEEQFSRVVRDKRFHQEKVAIALLRRCRERWGSEPHAALLDSHLALVATGRIRPSGGVMADDNLALMKARGWAHQGNVWRILFDFPAAGRAFDQAQAALEEGGRDDLIQAQVLQLRSSLLRAQRRFRWAMVTIDRAVRLFGRAEAWERQGKAYLVSAKLRVDSGDTDAAARELASALRLIDLNKPVRSSLVAASLKLYLLWRSESLEEAEEFLPEVRDLALELGSESDQLRVEWRAASIAADLGNTEEAEELYTEARAGFLELDNAYDVALVSLELSQLYAEQERHEEIQQLASEMIPIFQSNKIHRETLAAVQLFADAVRGEDEQQEIIGKFSAYLANARHDPSLRFSL